MPTNFTSLANKALVQLLQNGAVGVLPTDTVYGVATSAAQHQAVQRLYALKQRQKKPGTVIAANLGQLEELGFKARYLKAVAQYWPGAVSVVIPCVDMEWLHQGVGSVAVRIPQNKELDKLLVQTGPLLTSSANTPGSPPAGTMTNAREYFGDAVDFYVDGGDLHGRKASTVIRVVDDVVEVLREGAVTIDAETGKVLT